MKYYPNDPHLEKHLDHYWIVENASHIFGDKKTIFAYPGITPELLIVLDGHFSFRYNKKTYRIDDNQLFSFIHHFVELDMSTLKSFVIIQFKPRALSSLLPFIKVKATDLIRQPVCPASSIFGPSVTTLQQRLKQSSPIEIVALLNQWFYSFYKKEGEGFLLEMVNELGKQYSVSRIRHLTRYSYSTLERYFKKETGLTPKKYQSLQRYKGAVEEIYDTHNSDWLHYVDKYGYFDQSHFIKEIKRYTTFTPSQLLLMPGLRSLRPENL